MKFWYIVQDFVDLKFDGFLGIKCGVYKLIEWDGWVEMVFCCCR